MSIPDGTKHHFTTDQIKNKTEGSDASLPFSTRIVAKFIGTDENSATFKFTDADGITKKAVRMVVPQSGVSFSAIKEFAKNEGSDVSGIENESPAAGYAFEYWMKAQDKSAAESTNNYSADTSFTPKFVKQVSYTVNTGVGNDKKATFELAYGDVDGQYAKTIYNKAIGSESLDAAIENPASQDATMEFSAWNIILADGGTVKLTKDEINNTLSGKGAEKIRSGASMSPYFIKSGMTTVEYVFKTFDYNTKQEQNNPVQIEVEKRNDNQYKVTWNTIKEEAGAAGISIFSPMPPTGYVFKGWRENDTETLVGLQDDSKEYPANTSFKIKFTKDLTYSVDKGDGHGATNVPVTVTYPDGEYTLKQIFGGNGATTPDKSHSPDPATMRFENWAVKVNGRITKFSTDELNASTDVYPSGTQVYPNWAKYGAGGATGESSTRSMITSKTPEVGDGVTSDGRIVAKDIAGSDSQLIGYVYKVDANNKTVYTVSKDTFEKPWALTTAAAYTGEVGSGPNRNVKMREFVHELESGYET